MKRSSPVRFMHDVAEPAYAASRPMHRYGRRTIIMDTLLFINSLFAVFAVLFGVLSRNFSTALVTGLFIGLIHAGIVALHGAQAGTIPISDLPYVAEALDAAMSTGYLTFSNARYLTYLAGSATVLMAVTIVCYLVRRIACRTVCSLMPKRQTAS
jgi:hypothetical protein